MSYKRENTYTFIYNGKKIVMTHCPPKIPFEDKKKGVDSTKKSKRPFHLVSRHQFLKKSKEVLKKSEEEGIIYDVIALSSSRREFGDFPHWVHHILTNFSDTMPQEVPGGLPPKLSPLRNIQHVINIVVGLHCLIFYTAK